MLKITDRSYSLDFVRWLSAFFVVISHARSILLEDYNSNISNVFYKAIYFLTGFGHQAVIIFFVLSGYLICNSIISQYKSGNFNLKKYGLNRSTRIYIVLIPALLLTLLFDKLGSTIDHLRLYYDNEIFTSLKAGPIYRLSFKYFITSILMLQNIVLPTYGSNGPLWSLNFEFWYYTVIPFIIGLFFKRRLEFIIYIFIVLIFFSVVPNDILKYGLFWLCGLIPYFISINSKWKKLTILFVIIALSLSRIYYIEFYSDLSIAIALSLFICTLDNVKLTERNSSINQILASFSYTLYLIHYPLCLCLLVTLNRFIVPSIKVPISFISMLIFALCLITIYLFTYIIAKFTEYKTDSIRKILIN